MALFSKKPLKNPFKIDFDAPSTKGCREANQEGAWSSAERKKMLKLQEQTMELFSAQEQRDIHELAELLKKADSALFITGAGISAESGLPTYRGIGGLYNDEHPEEGLPIEVILSGEMMKTRPELCWRYIYKIEEACRDAQFNQAHQVLADWEVRLPRLWVLTQNVDGLHHQAGTQNLIDIHGDVHQLLCTACDYTEQVDDYSSLEIPPKCPKCSRLVRPDVVLFGEILPSAKLSKLQMELNRGFDLVFTIGTTSVFPYISMPVQQAAMMGIPTVEINPGETEVSSKVKYTFRHQAGMVLNAIDLTWKSLVC